MVGLMLKGHEEYTSHLARQRTMTRLQFFVKIRKAGTDTLLEIEDRRMQRPVLVLLGNFRVRLLLVMRIQKLT